ncbi:MAG: glycosyltransferase family 2 protein [Candidatus Methylomirabilales bacterium]
MPRVSVIIPARNHARQLGRALASVLGQTYRDLEVLVADDGSTDETPALLEALGDPVQHLYQPPGGSAAARNLGLSKASGELIAHMDPADRWYPQKLERQVAYLDAHAAAGLVHADATWVDDGDWVIRLRADRETRRPVPRGHCLLPLLGRFLTTSAVLERRALTAAVPAFDARLAAGAEQLRWILLALHGVRVGYLDEPLVLLERRRTPDGSDASDVPDAFTWAAVLERLLREASLAERGGPGALRAARRRLCEAGQALAAQDLREGRRARALGRLLSLIARRPLALDLYPALVRACRPAAPARDRGAR